MKRDGQTRDANKNIADKLFIKNIFYFLPIKKEKDSKDSKT